MYPPSSRRVATLYPRISLSKVLVFGATFIAAGVFLHSITQLYSIRNPLHIITHQYSAAASPPSVSEALRTLFDQIRVPVDADSFTDPYGEEFPISEDGPWWTEPLKNRILIVDTDTRVPEGENELWHEGRMNWDTITTEDGTGVVSAGQMNHFLYAQIHGYDYRPHRCEPCINRNIQPYKPPLSHNSPPPGFLHSPKRPDMDNSWIKPFIFSPLLPDYQFVVFLDADATFFHLEVPLEFLFNRWSIRPDTSIAMPLDHRKEIGDNDHVGVDEKGNMEQNSGVIIVQNLPYTYEMLDAWTECPEETRYEGCGRWKHEWAHEQRAFALYIRYDFNPNGTNIVEIPCKEAMGYPGSGDVAWIADNCTGQFIRHHTIAKDLVKRSTELPILQAFTDLARKELLENKDTYLVHNTPSEESETDEAVKNEE